MSASTGHHRDHPARRGTARAAATVVLLAAAGVAAASGSWLLAGGFLAVTLLVAFGGPSVVGRPDGSRRTDTGDLRAAEVKAWRTDHPGASVHDAVRALRR